MIDEFISGDLGFFRAMMKGRKAGSLEENQILALKNYLEMMCGGGGLEDYEKIRGDVRKSLEKMPLPHEFHVLLLNTMISLALNHDRSDEAERLLPGILQMNGEGLSVECRRILYGSMFQFYFDEGLLKKASSVLSEAERLPVETGSPTWLLIKSHSFDLAVQQHRFPEARAILRELAPWKKGLSWMMSGPYEILEARLFCRESRIDEALETLDASPLVVRGGWEGDFFKLRMDLLIRLERFEEADELLNVVAPQIRPTSIPTLMVPRFISRFQVLSSGAILHLARHNYSQARSLVMGAMEEVRPHSWRMERKMQELLLEIELASRQTRSARLLLQMLDPETRRRKTIRWARLNILEGSMEKAVEPFRAFLHSKTPSRVREQLRFAHDLEPHRFAELMVLIFNSKPSTGIKGGGEEVENKKSVAEIPLVGDSPVIRELRDSLPKLASSDLPVLISGETGCGKDVVAQQLHAQGSRSRHPFIAVNCGSLTESLIESEFSGHVKGAFTGAGGDREGLFLAAGKGTLFLDEISSMSPQLQASLLRVLENQEIRPVGGNQTHAIRCRVIAATNIPLEKAVHEGKFRQDLYYRLARIHLNIPPLRERKGDVSILARYFLEKFCEGIPMTIGDDLLQAMENYDWPGNVRELRNEVERIIFNAGNAQHLSASFLSFGTVRGLWPSPKTSMAGGSHPGALPAPVVFPDESSLSPRRSYRAQRLQRLRDFFKMRIRATQGDVIRQMQGSHCTAIADLKILEREGVIKRVVSPSSGRTQFFEVQPGD